MGCHAEHRLGWAKDLGGFGCILPPTTPCPLRYQGREFALFLYFHRHSGFVPSDHSGDQTELPALSPRADLDPYLWLDTGGECYQPQRGVLTKPKPTTWVRKCLPVRLPALKGRDRGYSPFRCHPFPCLAKAYFALSGLATRTRDVFRPRPLARAVLGRPYRARWGVGNARTRGVQQKIWDTLSPKGEG